MKRRDFLSVTAGLAGAGLAGCTDFADSADFDAGSSEAGPTQDSSMGMEDVPEPEDAGTPPEDAGTPPEDAGTPPEDAGPGEADAGPDAGPGEMCVTIMHTVSGGHGPDHADGAEVPSMADVMAAADKTYNIQGASGHAHTITVTAANFASLAAGDSVDVDSIADDTMHGHTVTLQCMSA